MIDELTIGISIAIGAILTYVVIQARRKIWYLETMNPRQHYELGKERKVIVNMTINKRPFNGFEAGKYRVLLLYGDIGTFSKAILRGKIEEMYMTILAESLVARKLVTRIERLRVFDFFFRQIPSLSTKAFLLTGELISPQDVLDHCWMGTERDKALTEMRRRRLIAPTILWVKPYPPEDKLKEIMAGTLMIPDLVSNHQEEFTRVTATARDTLIEIDAGIAKLLTVIIPLERDIITSISDPIQVIGMVIADRARKAEGLGLEQLAEKGGLDSAIQAAKILNEKRKEFLKLFEAPIKEEEVGKVGEKITGLLKRVDMIEAQLRPKTEAKTS